MKKIATMLMAVLFFPALVLGAELMGTVEKLDKGKKQIMLKTAKGQEAVEFNSGTKGAEKVKVGDKIAVTYSQKGEKLLASEIIVAKGETKTSPFEKPALPSEKKEKPSVPGDMK
jgi:hypothetical protein